MNRIDRARQLGIPDRHFNAKLIPDAKDKAFLAAHGITATDAQIAVRKFLNSIAIKGKVRNRHPRNVPGCLVVCGDAGQGKTDACCAALQALTYKEEMPHEYMSELPTLRRRFIEWGPRLQREFFNDRLKAEREADMDAMGLTVWDDVGLEYQPTGSGRDSWLVKTLDDEIRYREAHLLPLIISTNLTNERAIDYFGDRILSRFKSWATVVNCFGPDLRAKKTS